MPYLFGGAFGVALVLLWLYVIYEVITTDPDRCRNLPKMLWVIVVIFLPTVGSIAWQLLGRPQPQRSFSTPPVNKPAPRGVEDRDDWVDVSRKLLNQPPVPKPDPEAEKQKIRDAADERSRKLREWESRLIQREKQLDDRERDQRNQQDEN